jgi:hypothetical protein
MFTELIHVKRSRISSPCPNLDRKTHARVEDYFTLSHQTTSRVSYSEPTNFRTPVPDISSFTACTVTLRRSLPQKAGVKECITPFANPNNPLSRALPLQNGPHSPVVYSRSSCTNQLFKLSCSYYRYCRGG